MIVIIYLPLAGIPINYSNPKCDTGITKQTKLQVRDLFVMNDY
jgi:hypothetical protein